MEDKTINAIKNRENASTKFILKQNLIVYNWVDKGYNYIIVNGEVTFKDGECSNETPGLFLRNGSAKGKKVNLKTVDAA